MKKKFESAIKRRKEDKKLSESAGCFKPVGNSNHNAARPPLRRQNSRLSAPTLNTIDFVYNGNTEPINNLIKHCGKGGHSA